MEKLTLKSLKLDSGSHNNPEAGLCVMEAVAYFAGEPHSDAPQCACPVLTKYMIKLNDRMHDKERQLLKPYIKKLIGTRDGKSQKRVEILVRAAVAEITPYALRLTKIESLIEHAEKLERFKKEATYKEMRSAADAASAAADYADYAASAADAAAYAADADAASAAADYADYAAAAYAADAASAAADYADYAGKQNARNKAWKIALKALDRALKV